MPKSIVREALVEPDQPRIDRAECSRRSHLDAAMANEPLDLARREVRIENETGDVSYRVELGRQLGAAVGGSSILPDDRACQWPVGGPIPRHDGLALVGDPDRRDGESARSNFVNHLSEGGDDRVPDFLGIVFDPTGFREVLGELSIRGDGRCGVAEESPCPNSGGAGVDGDHYCVHV